MTGESCGQCPLFLGVAWTLPLASEARNAGPAKNATDLGKVVPMKSGLQTVAQSQAQCWCQKKRKRGPFSSGDIWHRRPAQSNSRIKTDVTSFPTKAPVVLPPLPPGSRLAGELGKPGLYPGAGLPFQPALLLGIRLSSLLY